MVVKSATKEAMDLGIAENFAHTLANDRKWDDVKVLSARILRKFAKQILRPPAQFETPLKALSRKTELQVLKQQVQPQMYVSSDVLALAHDHARKPQRIGALSC